MKSRLAISLSWIGGYVNTIAWLYCGAAVSHMSGNTTQLGQSIAHWAHAPAAAWGAVAFFGFCIFSFFLGACVSGLLTESARLHGSRSKFILPLAVEAVLLTIFSLVMNAHRGYGMGSGLLYVLSGLATFAMGLQNATVTKISGAVVRTTHVTGVVTDLGLEGMQYLLWLRERTRGGRGLERARRVLQLTRRQPAALRLMLLASIFGSFLFGAAVGTLVFMHAAWLAFAPPVCFLVFIIYVDATKPIADVKELDLLSDPELKMFGIVKTLLPAELGIYRLAPSGRHDEVHHAPNFTTWVEHLSRKHRVIILALSPLTRLDSNSVLDLEAALHRLKMQRRHLVLAGVRPVHFEALETDDVAELIGVENLCTDLEFAVARGLELVRDLRHIDFASEVSSAGELQEAR